MFVDIVIIDTVLRAVVLSAAALAWIVFLVRIVGLRSLSKMTSFDFATTLAAGSLLASAAQADNWQAFSQIVLAVGALLLFQFLTASARHRWPSVRSGLETAPLLLVRNGVIREDALNSSRVTREDLFAKLRQANVRSLAQVRCVVLETTGDFSVLHGESLDEEMLLGVERTSNESYRND